MHGAIDAVIRGRKIASKATASFNNSVVTESKMNNIIMHTNHIVLHYFPILIVYLSQPHKSVSHQTGTVHHWTVAHWLPLTPSMRIAEESKHSNKQCKIAEMIGRGTCTQFHPKYISVK